MNGKNNSKSICNWCGQPTDIVWVHGHGQCRYCGTNIDECCRGETCNVGLEYPDSKETVSKSSSDKN